MVILSLMLALAQDPRTPIEHFFGPWENLLAEHLHEGGLLDYRGLAAQRPILDAFLAQMQAWPAEDFARAGAAEREAFWINAYNAWTVALILDNPEVKSIRDLSGLFSSVFDRRFIPLQHLTGGKKPLSLGEIEHEILGKTARTPLFHFALVCASRSCPELRAEAYETHRLDTQLADQARKFLADTGKNDVAIADGKLRLSKIFDWSEEELSRYPGGIRSLLRAFGPEAVAKDPRLDSVKLRYRDYDWSLNAWLPPQVKEPTPAR